MNSSLFLSMALGLLMDPGIIIVIQNFSPAITSLCIRGELLDSMPWYFLIISLITLGLHPRHGVRLATLFGLNSGLNEAAKLAFHMPRPYWVSETVRAFSAHSSFGFPSGAAMSGAVTYGYIALQVRRCPVVIICFILLLATSLARIFCGIHFLLDILGGWILGFLLLAVFLLAAQKTEDYASRLSQPARLALFAVVSAIPILLVVPAYVSLGGWQVPTPWIELAFRQTGAVIHPDRIQYAWGAAGIIFGSLFGYEFLKSRGGWSPQANLKQRAGVVFAGTLSVLIVNAAIPGVWVSLGITALSPEFAAFLSMGGVTFWLMGGVPSLAIKAGFTK